MKVDKEIERDDGRKSKQTMIDTSIFLSTTSHPISKKRTLISRITTNPTSFFFTVTKGDNLYLQYGSLYARDVPKYRLHRGVLHSSDFCKRLMMVKVVGKYLVCLLPGLYIKGLIGKLDLSRGIVLC